MGFGAIARPEFHGLHARGTSGPDMFDLSENFGVRDAKGTRVGLTARHHDIAELVGASRPRVTEYLATFERKRLIVRDGRQLIVSREEDFLARTAAAST
jgi:hypothetical protein